MTRLGLPARLHARQMFKIMKSALAMGRVLFSHIAQNPTTRFWGADMPLTDLRFPLLLQFRQEHLAVVTARMEELALRFAD
jgi:hypothetical protein